MTVPRISIVTPSFQQGRFLERTLRSVHEQGYPDVEHLVVDGGSTDGSVEILERWSDRLAYWVSEPDGGQSNAINNGLRRATGEVVSWLNSDDVLLPGALEEVGARLASGTGAMALVGHCRFDFDDGGAPVILRGDYVDRKRLLRFWRGYNMHQPAIFWRREVQDAVGLLDESLHHIMDFDYWARIAQHFDFEVSDRVLAAATYHGAAKTGDGYRRYYADLRRHARGYWGLRRSDPRWWWIEAQMRAHQAINATRRTRRRPSLR